MTIAKFQFNMMNKAIRFGLVIAFFVTSLILPQAQAAGVVLPPMPAPGVMVGLSPEFSPAHLQGLTIHPDNALQFDFLINRGDMPLTAAQKKIQYKNLVKYFLASLTIPDGDQWVNLSPYEKDRIIKDDFGKTEMGRDLLTQDYLLKQITSSLVYPEKDLGKKFWDRVYARAWQEYKTTQVPVNTFNKVWIIPDEAAVYESGNTVYVLRNHLKVMLEEDYLSLKNHSGIQSAVPQDTNKLHAIGSQLIKEIVLPELEREVNQDKNFATLRQIYSGMILATWYKHMLKESLLGQVYANKAKVRGVDQDPRTNQAIYRQYLKAFKKGVFNYIKEDEDRYTNEMIPRKYFSGGDIGFRDGAKPFDGSFAMGTVEVVNENSSIPAAVAERLDSGVPTKGLDSAMVNLRTPSVGKSLLHPTIAAALLSLASLNLSAAPANVNAVLNQYFQTLNSLIASNNAAANELNQTNYANATTLYQANVRAAQEALNRFQDTNSVGGITTDDKIRNNKTREPMTGQQILDEGLVPVFHDAQAGVVQSELGNLTTRMSDADASFDLRNYSLAINQYMAIGTAAKNTETNPVPQNLTLSFTLNGQSATEKEYLEFTRYEAVHNALVAQSDALKHSTNNASSVYADLKNFLDSSEVREASTPLTPRQVALGFPNVADDVQALRASLPTTFNQAMAIQLKDPNWKGMMYRSIPPLVKKAFAPFHLSASTTQGFINQFIASSPQTTGENVPSVAIANFGRLYLHHQIQDLLAQKNISQEKGHWGKDISQDFELQKKIIGLVVQLRQLGLSETTAANEIFYLLYQSDIDALMADQNTNLDYQTRVAGVLADRINTFALHVQWGEAIPFQNAIVTALRNLEATVRTVPDMLEKASKENDIYNQVLGGIDFRNLMLVTHGDFDVESYKIPANLLAVC